MRGTKGRPSQTPPAQEGRYLALILAVTAALTLLGSSWTLFAAVLGLAALIGGRAWIRGRHESGALTGVAAILLGVLGLTVVSTTIGLAREADRPTFSVESAHVVRTSAAPDDDELSELDAECPRPFDVEASAGHVTCGVLVGRRGDGVYVSPRPMVVTFVPDKDIATLRTARARMCLSRRDPRIVGERLLGLFGVGNTDFDRAALLDAPGVRCRSR